MTEHASTEQPRTLVVIPARGGSVGVQCKNLQPVGERSLIARAVVTALRAGVGDIIVSTDDAEIAEQVRLTSATPRPGPREIDVFIRMRPPELATAEASSESVLRDALELPPCALGREPAHHYDLVILMQCTSPFTMPDDLQRMVELLSKPATCVVSVTPFHGFLWAGPGKVGGHALLHNPDKLRQRRQDRAAQYLENGALYGLRVADFMACGNRFTSPHPELLVMPKHRSLEIDDLWDLDCARRMDRWPNQ